jgi:hypothetical protein
MNRLTKVQEEALEKARKRIDQAFRNQENDAADDAAVQRKRALAKIEYAKSKLRGTNSAEVEVG